MGMQEKIARAIYEGRTGAGCKPWGRQPAAHKAPYLADATAALTALEEPTPEMVDAGWIDKEDVNPDEIFGAMIRAAKGGSDND